MILVDTSIWVDHLRAGLPALAHRLDRASVLGHPWVTGEIALGHLSRRSAVLGLLNALPQAEVATTAEVAALVEDQRLFGLGIGYVDAQLLASARLTTDALLWTADRRLASAASRLGVGVQPPAPGAGA